MMQAAGPSLGGSEKACWRVGVLLSRGRCMGVNRSLQGEGEVTSPQVWESMSVWEVHVFQDRWTWSV